MPALRQTANSLRAHWLRLIAISGVILAPCFWHRRIEATDLGSHLYNAWLVQLIHHGHAPGLWIAHRWNNVLFDFLLSGLGSIFGLEAASKIAVSLSVLIFFWGIFALVCAATQRAPWFLLPCIAIFTYGYTFHMGFFNYYISLGLAFFGVAIFWRAEGPERLPALAIAPLILLAHPLGLAWLICASAYIGIARTIPRRYHILLLLGALASLFLVHMYFWHHYIVEAPAGPFYWFNGTDQLILFGGRYTFVKRAFVLFAIIALAMDLCRRWRERGWWTYYSIPAQLYVIVLSAAILLPTGVRFPHQSAAVALLTPRLTSVSAALICCLLGAMQPRKWHLAASLTIAAIFFSFIYADTAAVNRMELQAEKLVRTLPPNQRVMATIQPLPGWRISIQHIADRACIGYCFSYGNYEPGSEMFRVRATPGNPYVLSDYNLDVEMEEGDYLVQPRDLPVYQLYQCSEAGTDLCIRPLVADEENGRLDVYPGRE